MNLFEQGKEDYFKPVRVSNIIVNLKAMEIDIKPINWRIS